MAEALMSAVIENLASMALHQIVKDVMDNAVALKTSLETIQAVLEDAERKQLTDSSLKLWLNKLKHVSHDMDHVLDEWNTAALRFRITEEEEAETENKKKELCFALPFSCFKSKAVVKKLTVRHNIGHKIKELNKKMDEIVREKDKFNLNNAVTVDRPVSHRTQTISFVEETDTYGRDGDKEVLVRRLVSGHTSGIEIVPVVGMGGLGKTTLAQLAFNNKTVKARFDNRIWVCVSDPFDIIKVAKAVVEAVEGTAPVINELETLLQRVRRCVEGKRFLLVLDDVWTRDGNKWEQLKQPLGFGTDGSRILVMTRKQEVAIMMGAASRAIALENLCEENCWLIFKRSAFLERSKDECQDLEGIGREITKTCKGLPLVAKILGGLLRFKKTQSSMGKCSGERAVETKRR